MESRGLEVDLEVVLVRLVARLGDLLLWLQVGGECMAFLDKIKVYEHIEQHI